MAEASAIVGVSRIGVELFEVFSVCPADFPRPLFGALALRGDLGDLGVLVALEYCLRSAKAFFSRIACSSGDGMTSFIFWTLAASLSTSSAAVGCSDSFEGRKAVGTLGTGGGFLGVAVRLGVPERELLVFRVPDVEAGRGGISRGVKSAEAV